MNTARRTKSRARSGPDAKALGREFAAQRVRRDLTQEVIAGRVGRLHATLSRIENGKHEGMRLLVSFADALDCNLVLVPRSSARPIGRRAGS